MHFGSIIAGLLKGKFLITALVGVTLLGGATVAAVASPAGQHVVSTITGKATVTPGNHNQNDDKNQKNNNNDNKDCPGQPEAQRLATKFGLSSTAKSTALMTICALHQGTFKGTSSKGTAITAKNVLGYGEIEHVLAQAQQLATKAGTKLSDANIQKFVADVVQSCGTTPLMQCVNAKDDQGSNNNSGTNGGDDHGNSGTNGGNNGGNDHGNGGGGKPTSTPTPPPHR